MAYRVLAHDLFPQTEPGDEWCSVFVKGIGRGPWDWEPCPPSTRLKQDYIYRRRLDPTPDNYRAMQSAWLSHFNVGVGSRVRVVRKAASYELGWNAKWLSEMDALVGKEFEVRDTCKEIGIIAGVYLFPFHVLAPVEANQGSSQPNPVSKSGNHPPAVPEGQGKETDQFGREVFRCSDCDGTIRRLEAAISGKCKWCRKADRREAEQESPTPAIERGEEITGGSGGVSVDESPDDRRTTFDLGRGLRFLGWCIDTIRDNPSVRDDYERFRQSMRDVEQPTPTPSAGQEEDDRFIEEEQTVLRLHDKEVTARWVDGVRSELGGDGSLVYLVRLLQKELADLRRQVADDDRLQCCNGCRHFTGGDVRHHPSCKWYPESLTKMQDDQQSELTRLRGEVERLTSIKRLLLHVLNGMMEVETNDWVVQQAATAISNAAMIYSGTYRPGSFMPTGSEGGVK